MEIIAGPPNRPGHYSPAVKSGNMLYISGQLPLDWNNGGKIVTGGAGEHARQAIENLKAVLESRGLNLGHIVKTTVLIPDVTLWQEVDKVYAACFGSHKPARSVIPTTGLHYGALVEIEAIAELP